MGQAGPSPSDLETLWEALLSEEEGRTLDAWSHLSAQEQEAVAAHLRRMSREPGWLVSQRRAARQALAALGLARRPVRHRAPSGRSE